jgi:hypothetical protein
VSASLPHHERPEGRRYEWGGLLPKQWAALAAVVGLLGGCISFAATDCFTTEHYLWNWDSFNERNVKAYFQIPPEAHIVSAVSHTPFPMGQDVTVVFRLPKTSSPKNWVKHIANVSGLGDDCRVGEFNYDGGGDGYTLSYDPQTEVYTAYWARD